MCECVITKLCDKCLYWLIHIHQLMHINLLYQCLRLSCPCVCVLQNVTCGLKLRMCSKHCRLFAKQSLHLTPVKSFH